MKKAIAITIKPQHLVNSLNGTKALEIRKNKVLYNAIKKMIFEEGKAIIVAVCSKAKPILFETYGHNGFRRFKTSDTALILNALNGKVVCSWECDEVYDIEKLLHTYWTRNKSDADVLKLSCLTKEEMHEYLCDAKCRYAIPIQNLKIFDEAKEIGELKHLIGYWDFGCLKKPIFASLKKAPQNMAYVGVKL